MHTLCMQTMPSPIDLLRRPDSVLVSMTADTPPANDYDPMWPLRAHPTLFPYGDGQCPTHMTLAHWTRTLLRRSDRRFARSHHFNMDMFNVIQRHNTNTQARVRLRLHPADVNLIAELSEHEVQLTFELLKANTRGPALSSALNNAKPGVRALFNAWKATGGHVLGSPQSFMSLRSQIWGMWNVLGPFSLFINLCPSEEHAQLCFELEGHKYVFNDDDRGTPASRADTHVSRPSVIECRRRNAADPRAAAAYFVVLLAAFARHFLGWELDPARKLDKPGMFGDVLGWFFKPETNQRGYLHTHALAVIARLQLKRLRAMLNNPAFKSHTLAFLESLMCQYLPDPLQANIQTAIDPALVPADFIPKPIVNANLVAKPMDRGLPFMAIDCQQPLHDNISDDLIRRAVAEGVLETNVHKHSFACDPNHAGNVPNDVGCRMAYARVLHTASTWDAENDILLLRRDIGSLVPYIFPLVLTMPFNQAFYLSAEMGRFARELALWTARRDADPTFKGPRPEKLSLEQTVALTSTYCTKYASKSEGVDARTTIHEIAYELAHTAACAPDTSDTDKACAARSAKRLAQSVNVITGGVTYPSVMTAFLHLHGKDHYMSHTVSVHDFHAFTRAYAMHNQARNHMFHFT